MKKNSKGAAKKPAAKAASRKPSRPAARAAAAKPLKKVAPAKPAKKAAKPAAKPVAAKPVKTPAKAARAGAKPTLAKKPAAATPVVAKAKKPKQAAKPAGKVVELRPSAAKPSAPQKLAPVPEKPAPAPAAAAKPAAAVPKPAAPAAPAAAAASRPAGNVVPMKAAAPPMAPAKQVIHVAPPPEKPAFAAGDYVVYPTHGVGKILGVEEQEIAGYKLSVFVVHFDKDRMTLRVPLGKAKASGLRKLSTRKEMDAALAKLRGRSRVKRTMWSRRAQEYEAKINSGDPSSIAEVVRDLYRNVGQPEQSYSERQIYQAALDRLVREFAAVEKIDEETATKRIEQVLNAA
ncbi:MAG: CarD family transcriptional regulator [Rhodospirillales bacterium]|nr:CarD family transcriptional regulator [Rhodospirillales bacterium]